MVEPRGDVRPVGAPFPEDLPRGRRALLDRLVQRGRHSSTGSLSLPGSDSSSPPDEGSTATPGADRATRMLAFATLALLPSIRAQLSAMSCTRSSAVYDFSSIFL